jgi:hypothetical protein
MLLWDSDVALDLFSCCPFVFMNQNKTWNFLSWNVRGLNAQAKWDHPRCKIPELSATIIGLQEAKRDNFDQPYIPKFCPDTSIN